MQNNWFKNEETDTIWWLDNGDEKKGIFIFSFDQKKQYNLFEDYPHNMKPEEVVIFNNENPFWQDFFKERVY